MKSSQTVPPKLSKPSISTLLRYLKSELSLSEKLQVEEALKIYPECRDILKGLELMLIQYGVKTEERLIRSSVSLLSRIGRIQCKIESYPEIKSKFVKMEQGLKSFINDFQVTPGMVMSGGSIAFAASFSISRGLIESLWMFYALYSYLILITTYKILNFNSKLAIIKIWSCQVINDFVAKLMRLSNVKFPKHISSLTIFHYTHSSSNNNIKNIPRIY